MEEQKFRRETGLCYCHENSRGHICKKETEIMLMILEDIDEDLEIKSEKKTEEEGQSLPYVVLYSIMEDSRPQSIRIEGKIK